MPPKGYLWKNNSSGCWYSKVPPLGSHSRSWRKHSDGTALLMCVQCAWRDFLELEGLCETLCPIPGFLDRDLAAEDSAEHRALASGQVASSSGV